jgi:ABC-type molybdate transport system substrate-binding protein
MTMSIFLMLFAVPLTPAPSAAADIQVFTSGAPSAVQKKLAPAFTKATGHNVVITAETLGAIRKRLAGDSKPDVVVLPRPALLALDKAGALRSGSMVNIARVGIGVVVREGAPVPDISSVDALRKTLLNAKSIAHPDPKGGGFTGAHIDRMFERLGIAEAVRPKVMLGFAFTGGVANIAKGSPSSACSTSAKSSRSKACGWSVRCRPSIRVTSSLPAPCMVAALRRSRRRRIFGR